MNEELCKSKIRELWKILRKLESQCDEDDVCNKCPFFNIASKWRGGESCSFISLFKDIMNIKFIEEESIQERTRKMVRNENPRKTKIV